MKTLPVEQNVIDAAQASHKKFWPRGPFVSVSLAQYGLESAWGKYPSGVNNYFGIKAGPGEDATARYTHEVVDGKVILIVARFRNFASLEDGFDGHALLLTTPHYAKCVNADNPFAYCQALHDCGYATDPHYAQSLMNIIEDYGLVRYDQSYAT